MPHEAKLSRFAGWAGLAVAALGSSALFGAITGWDLLAALRPDPLPMKANTALALLLAGGSLWAQHRARHVRAPQ